MIIASTESDATGRDFESPCMIRADAMFAKVGASFRQSRASVRAERLRFVPIGGGSLFGSVCGFMEPGSHREDGLRDDDTAS